jgi:hypothetical protein
MNSQGKIHRHAYPGVADAAKLNLAAGGLNEPDYGKKGADSGGTRNGADVAGLVQRRPADIRREPGTVAIVGGQVLKIKPRRTPQNWLAFSSTT